MKRSVLFGIKAKFVLITAIIVAVFSSIWGSSAVREERAHLLHNLEEKGRLVLSSLKAPIINTIILQEIGMLPQILDNFIEEISRIPELPTAYAYITDADGKVLAHSRYEEFGKIYNDEMLRETLADEGFHQNIVQWEGKHILDMAMPLRVSGKNWGALRIGLSLAPMEKEFLVFKTRIFLSSLLFFFAGTAIFYLIGCTMSRPLERLSQVMSNIDLGAFEATSFPPRRDEIGMLQEAFHSMLVRLRQSELERQHALNYVIQQDKMATIGKIVAGVAHEINNPLAAISASLYSLESKVPPESLKHVHLLKSGIDRIGDIVVQLSDFSRVTAVDLDYLRSDQFFREIEMFAVMALNEHGLALKTADLCKPPVYLHIDKGKMHQVLLNLLLNAAYASPDKSSIQLIAATSGNFYTLSVTDYGSGIPAENLDKVFDIFFTTKPAGHGTGIGLAVCRSIVDLHHGSLSAESIPGQTTFTVKIPMREEL